MHDDKPTLESFKSDIESLFGDVLSEYMAQSVDDFWNHWSLFDSSIDENDFSIHVDPASPGQSFPDYRRYRKWTVMGTVSFLLGIILIWFIWEVGLCLIALGIGAHFFGGHIKYNDANNFCQDLVKDIVQHSTDGGFARMCANYMTGVIQLNSSKGSARWPRFPSNAVTGEETYIY